MSEWKEYKLGDVTTSIKDRINTSELDVKSYISTENMLPDKAGITISSGVPLGNAIKFLCGDILISNIRPYFKKIWKATFDGGCSADVICFRASDKVTSDYLYYLLSQDSFFDYVMKGSKGTKMPRGDRKHIDNWTIYLPSTDIQKQITFVLKSLDDKIENNRKINKNLEQQAQALFKSWFIDFEPFKDGKFIDSELGLIPEGWRVNSAETIYNINIGKTPPRKQQQWFSNDSKDVVWVSISDMGNCGTFINDSSEYLTKEAIQKFNIVLVPQNSILLSFKLTIGRIAIANCQLTTNEAIARFTTEDMRERDFLYFYLKNFNYSSLGSTSSIATAVNSKIVKKMPILIPPIKILDAFHKIVYHNLERIRINQLENKRLSILRDTLLPKLISGEIEV